MVNYNKKKKLQKHVKNKNLQTIQLAKILFLLGIK